MERRDARTARYDKREAIKTAEAAGQVADSIEARVAIVKRMEAGEITLAEGQAELKRLKRNAKKNGQVTRSQVWRQS